MNDKLISNIKPLGFTWETRDPFLFCVHHLDHYPPGNEKMGPAASLEDRQLGQDFVKKDGWRMYHGNVVPGFPAHPHRGFETVTVVLDGFIDHSDSGGAAARYGNGDVQWMSAGQGLQHSEMFPLLNTEKGNTLELFQIWLNLPGEKKYSAPHFVMFWNENIPNISFSDDGNRKTTVTLIAGELERTKAPAPAPESWAANPENDLGIWLIKMEPHAQWTIPQASAGTNRSLYFYQGTEVSIADKKVQSYHSLDLLPEEPVTMNNSDQEACLLLLQGKPINEPVVQHGPFVMNSPDQIQTTMAEFRRTGFGGWPWNSRENVHPRDMPRFAKYGDGSESFPKNSSTEGFT